MKRNADAHRRDSEIQLIGKVLLSIEHPKMAVFGTLKLLAKHAGPFKVVQRLGKVALLH